MNTTKEFADRLRDLADYLETVSFRIRPWMDTKLTEFEEETGMKEES